MVGFFLTFPQKVASMEGFTMRNFRLLKDTQLKDLLIIYKEVTQKDLLPQNVIVIFVLYKCPQEIPKNQ